MSFIAACVQLTSTNNIEENCRMTDALVREAASGGAKLILLPENVFMLRASDTDEVYPYTEAAHPGVLLCQSLAKELDVWILIGSLLTPSGTLCEQGKGKWYNRSLLINANGQIAARYDKIHLFDAMINDGVRYQESARIERGNQICVATTPWGRLGMSICYDVRFPHLHREMAQAGASMIAIPAAFAEYTGKAHWHVMVRARAIETGCFVFAPGQAGIHNGGRKTYGHSLIIGPWGEILAEGDSTSTGIVSAEIDLDYVKDVRSRLPSLYHDRDYLPLPEYDI
jgi:predicted amidohydrolase